MVTGLFALAACGPGKAPPETPAPDPAGPGVAPETPPEGLEPPMRNPPPPTLLNGRDDLGRAVLRHPDGTCFVNLPPPPPPPDHAPSFQPPPTQAVPCPPEMADPSWAACAYGLVEEIGGSCVCRVFGNPPPPPRTLAGCPTPVPNQVPNPSAAE